MTVRVEVGSADTATTKTTATTTTNTTAAAATAGGDNEAYLLLQAKKRTSRVILRNLSFYATERDIRRVMEERFGKVVDINLPLVPSYRTKRTEDTGACGGDGDGDDASNKRRRQHRGFAFVTFDTPTNACLAVESCAGAGGEDEDAENATTQVLIKKRPVAIDLSLPKVQHKGMLKEQQKEKLEEEDGSDEHGSDEEEDGSTDDGSTDDEDDNGGEEGSTSDYSDSVSKESDNTESDTPAAPPIIQHDQTPRNALFLRNLPFDATRHDIFTAFYRFGHIEGIFIIRDRTTNSNRRTAFVNYKTEEGCRRGCFGGYHT